MKINGFQVYNYRSIIDSGWVELSDLSVLVGKNESGKTSLLRALHKFHPFKADPYSIDKEWPRGRRQNRSTDAIVCRVGFDLEDAELVDLGPMIDDRAKQGGPFIVSRTYSGKYSVELSGEVFPERPPRTAIAELVKGIAELSLPTPTGISSGIFNQCIERVVGFAYAGQVDAIAQAGKDMPGLLLANQTEPLQSDDALVKDIAPKVGALASKLQSATTIKSLVDKFVIGRLPVFIYMDDYRAFRGTALLDQVKTRKDSNTLTDEDKTLTTILELSGLTLDSEFAKGQSNDESVKEQRIYDLNDAGLSLTREIAERWKQRRYEVEFRADRHLFHPLII